jgi:hypothetical protein
LSTARHAPRTAVTPPEWTTVAGEGYGCGCDDANLSIRRDHPAVGRDAKSPEAPRLTPGCIPVRWATASYAD